MSLGTMEKEKSETESNNIQTTDSVFKVNELNLWYRHDQALKNINFDIFENQVTAMIGPSGCGKSTFLKSLNRMVELIPTVTVTGKILYRGENILDLQYHVEEVRSKVGMVFQKPSPFPKSIYENVAFGPKLHGIRKKKVLDEIVEKSLRNAAIWDEVKDRLNAHAYGLSGGQQQRLCIARCLAVEPDVILMDEPTSALDPIATLKVEELVAELKENYSIVIVTHNMQQAARVSDRTAFFLSGQLIEVNDTSKIFSNPSNKKTEDYITGRFG